MDATKLDRFEELQEMKNEFILNESVFENENPSWGEVAESNSKAELLWNETAEGKELLSLENELWPIKRLFYWKDITND